VERHHRQLRGLRSVMIPGSPHLRQQRQRGCVNYSVAPTLVQSADRTMISPRHVYGQSSDSRPVYAISPKQRSFSASSK
jgi:hypothetical protein